MYKRLGIKQVEQITKLTSLSTNPLFTNSDDIHSPSSGSNITTDNHTRNTSFIPN